MSGRKHPRPTVKKRRGTFSDVNPIPVNNPVIGQNIPQTRGITTLSLSLPLLVKEKKGLEEGLKRGGNDNKAVTR